MDKISETKRLLKLVKDNVEKIAQAKVQKREKRSKSDKK